MNTMVQTRTQAADNSGLKPEWRTGEGRIPYARYTSPEFARLEAERLWFKVWQMACRIDQIPEPGSYTVYDILDQSVVVVRVDQDTVKAYHNVCPHRATALATGSGRFQLGSIVCPFHGWKWALDGQCTFLPARDEFAGGCLQDEEVALREVHVRVWAGSVYISLAREPEPFDELFAPVAELVDGVRMADMRFYWHIQVKVNANWKVAQEAFMEAYHVPQTHPQLVNGLTFEEAGKLYRYHTFEHGHGLFQSGGVTAMGRVPPERLRNMSQDEQVDTLLRMLGSLESGQDAQVHTDDMEIARSMRYRPLPEGALVGQEFQKVLREHYAAKGRVIADTEALAKVTDMHIFPHITYLPMFGNLLMYRARPSRDNDPDWCIFDMYALRTYSEGQTPPAWETRHPEGDLSKGKNWYLIPSQDFTSILKQQQGMHSLGAEGSLLAGHQESIILNMHREIDRYLM
ncbi:MAG: Rieske 2Fe-2S domain-containing protein [Alphaproteobacteria bacterium]|nr:Rieske 2Fe-2S domain-containing protein [Alphaproteobacteria bacterium]